MEITIEQIQDIQRKAEQHKQKIERLKGSHEQLMKQLKTEFECDSLDEAKTKMEEIKEEGKNLSSRIEKMKQRVVDEWDKFNSVPGIGG